MIDAGELNERAAELSLAPEVVEKDYVLGWLLAGIDHHDGIRDAWAFKGGTCLKKVHFETYRFSEDLDFTLTDVAQLDQDFLSTAFSEIAEWVYERCGIVIPADQLRFDVRRNKRGHPTIEGRVYYRGPRGPLRPQASLPKVKLDLTADEVLVLEPARLRVVHPYSDEPAEGIKIRCYPYAEIFGEKVRALGERGRPRDLYDVVNLFRHEEARALAPEVHRILGEKCSFKGIPTTTLATIEPYREEMQGAWQPMLGHQLPSLPPFETYWNEVPVFFRWLEERVVLPVPVAFPVQAGEEVIRVPTGTLTGLGLPARPLEAIRFAAANHLRVDLTYTDQQGRTSTRAIEPYSLRRTADGAVVLHAERADGSGHRAYRVDRIRSAAVTAQPFTPRYAIELTPTGHQPVPLGHGALNVLARSANPPASRGRRGAAAGPSYVYECNYCGKRFTHRSRDGRLNPHKDKTGWACPGRTGWFVETR